MGEFSQTIQNPFAAVGKDDSIHEKIWSQRWALHIMESSNSRNWEVWAKSSKHEWATWKKIEMSKNPYFWDGKSVVKEIKNSVLCETIIILPVGEEKEEEVKEETCLLYSFPEEKEEEVKAETWLLHSFPEAGWQGLGSWRTWAWHDSVVLILICDGVFELTLQPSEQVTLRPEVLPFCFLGNVLFLSKQFIIILCLHWI